MPIFLAGHPYNGPDKYSAYGCEGNIFAGCGVFNVAISRTLTVRASLVV
jgi:hypothetical protein